MNILLLSQRVQIESSANRVNDYTLKLSLSQRVYRERVQFPRGSEWTEEVGPFYRQGDTQGTYISYISSSTGRHSVSEYVRRTFPILVETGKHSGYVSYFHPLRMYCLQMIVFNSPKLLFRGLFNDSYFH